MTTKSELKASNKIVLRSVNGKVNQKYYMNPCRDPRTGQYPDVVKRVNSQGDMILTDAERNSGKYYIKETQSFIIEDGKTFNLDDPYDAAEWEAIKHCPLIAPDRYAKDAQGNFLIDGTMGWKNIKPRYGVAELYIERPGEEAVQKVNRKRLIHNAVAFILNDPKGSEGRVMMARLLGKHMTNIPDADVEDYLLTVAEKNPKKIIALYSGDDTNLRICLMDALDRHVIRIKDKLYIYSDNIVLGATDDAVITWMKDARNAKVLELIRKDTYPDMYSSDTKSKS